MIYYLNSLGTGVNIDSFWHGTQAEYNNILSPNASCLYIIEEVPRVLTSMYLGDKKIYPTSWKNYDYIVENIECYGDVALNTGIKIFTQENASRAWEMEFDFNANRVSSGSSEHAVIGSSSSSSATPAIEFYCTGSGQNLTFYHRRVDGTTISKDVNIGNINNYKKIKLHCENGILSVYVDDSLFTSITWSVVGAYDFDLFVGSYRADTYYWNGLIKTFTFKWLS